MIRSGSGVINQRQAIRFDSDYQAILDRAIALGYILPSRTQQIRQNSLVGALKAHGVWNYLDVLYVFANDGSREFGRLNWKNPNSFEISEFDNPDWVNNAGFKRDSASGYLDTNYVPSTNGSQFVLNSSCVGMWVHSATDGGAATRVAIGVTNTSNTSSVMLLDVGSSNIGGRINNDPGSNPGFNLTASWTSGNSYTIRRTASNATASFINGVSVQTSSVASTALPNQSIYILANQNQFGAMGSPVTDDFVISSFWLGSGSLDQLALHNAFSEYKTNIASSSPYTTEYQDILDRATTLGYQLPTEKEKIWQNQFLYDLKVHAIWSATELLYNLSVHDSEFALINWKSPNNFHGVISGTPVFSKHNGYIGNGVAYIDTGFVPSTNSSVASINNSSLWAYSNGVAPQSNSIDVGASSVANLRDIYVRNSADTDIGGRNANSTTVNSTTSFGAGLLGVQRRTSTDARLWKRGLQVNTNSSVSLEYPDRSFYLLANHRTTPVNPTENTVGFVLFGSQMAGHEFRIYSILDKYQAHIKELDADYKNIIHKAIQLGYVRPTIDQQIKQSDFIKKLKVSGIWEKLDILYVFASDGSSNFATLNWKNPNDNQITLVNSPTFTNNLGFNGNGSTSYLNTNWLAASEGVNYTLNDSSVGYYSPSATTVLIATRNASTSQRIYFHNTNGTTSAIALNSANANFTNTQGNGFFHGKRISSTSLSVYLNGISLGTSSTTSSAIPTLSLTLLAQNNNGVIDGLTTGTLSMFWAGASLNGKELEFYNLWNDYFTTL